MGSSADYGGLAAALFGKTRQAVLALTFGHAEQAFYVRQIVRAVQAGQGAVQRELRRLSEAGILRRTVRGRHIYYQANADCPIYGELRTLVAKTAGVAGILQAALAPLSDRIRVAFVHGSIVDGRERTASDVDVLIVGRVSFAEVVSALSQSQHTLSREINPSVYPPEEFARRLSAQDHFLGTVVRRPKIFLMGDDDELARLAGHRLAE